MKIYRVCKEFVPHLIPIRLSLRLKYIEPSEHGDEVLAELPNGFLEHLLECLVKECLQQP